MRAKIVLVLILVSCLTFCSLSYGQFKVIGYLPTWNGYPSSINNVDLTKLTHINIAFANPNSSGDLLLSGGTLANMATVVNTAHAQNVKVLVSIGGAGAPGATYKNLIVANVSAFVTKIVQYTIDNNLDGIDVDIEGDVLNGTTMTSAQYETFITALETGLHGQGKLMTAALATWFANRVTNTAASKFDFINVMSYDAYGTWTGPGQHSPYDDAVSDLYYWQNTKGVPGSKLTLGVPFYGYYWGTSNSSYSYKYIVTTYPDAEYKDQVNPGTGGVILYNGIPTIKQKTVLALEQASGIMIWELTGDATGTKSLISAINEVIVGYPANVAPTVSITAPVASTTYTEGDTIEIDINAVDNDGTIMKTEYFADTYKIGEQYGTPTTMKWSGAGAGTYLLSAIVTDNIGSSVTSSTVSVTVNAASSSLPFTGTPLEIPGKIEAENFNLGGNNLSYYDLTSTNLGGSYRTGRVDIEICSDNGSGYDVGWTDAGEWLEYSVNITATGKYDLQTRVATQNSGKTFHIEIDGVNVTGTLTAPNTTAWYKWQTVTASNIQLTQGIHKMKIAFTTGGFNLNYINAVVSTPTALLENTVVESINAVYPNPVTQTSHLRFQLKQSGQTRVVVFDGKGKELMVLADSYMAAGENELVILRGDFPKGIYFCKISGTEEVIGLKMIMD